jgi:drug/metabolite transporter (DMT)-like permease
MWFIAALGSAVVFGLAGFLMKLASSRSAPADNILFGLYITGALSFFLYGMYSGVTSPDISHIAAGVIVGIGSVAGNILFMKAIRIGPVSLTSPVVNLNIVLVVFMAIFVYGEVLSVRETVAIVLIIVGLSLLPTDPNEKLTIRHRSWYLMVGVAVLLFFLRNGGLKITEEFGLQNTLVLLIAYGTGVLWFGIRRMPNNRADVRKIHNNRNHGFVTGLLAGLFSFGGMQLYAYALATGPAGIVSPLFSANSLVTGLLAVLLLGERLTLYQMISLAVIFTGIILLRL